MDQTTPNLKLPYIAPGQAQKHITHNEAIRQLDALIHLSVKTIATTPPQLPENGDRYLVDSGATGAFAREDQNIAAFQDGGWSFYPPETGWRAYVEDQAQLFVFEGQNWLSLDPSLNPVDKVGVNIVADDTNRLAIKSPASLFDQMGGGHQLKINKSSESDTASLILQTNYSGHAEIGLAGDNDLNVKVSQDGQSFKTALKVDRICFQSGII